MSSRAQVLGLCISSALCPSVSTCPLLHSVPVHMPSAFDPASLWPSRLQPALQQFVPLMLFEVLPAHHPALSLAMLWNQRTRLSAELRFFVDLVQMAIVVQGEALFGYGSLGGTHKLLNTPL